MINADFCSIELLSGKLRLCECTTWAHTISRSSEPAIKKNLNEQLFNMGILARRAETESTIFVTHSGVTHEEQNYKHVSGEKVMNCDYLR